MKEKVFLVFLLVVILLSACSNMDRQVGDISDEMSIYEEYIGYYSLSRVNNLSSWREYGEWSSDFELLKDGNKRIFLASASIDNAYFYSDSEHDWVIKENSWGEEYAILIKK